MMIRQKMFRIGQRVKLRDPEKYGSGDAYPLPPGWQDGEEVTIIGFDHGYVRVLGDGTTSDPMRGANKVLNGAKFAPSWADNSHAAES